MSDEANTNAIDLIRWTFTPDPAHRAEIEGFLTEHGLEVVARGEGQLVALWDEPEGEIDEVIEQLWEINGEAFEVTHEEFHRRDLLVYHHDAEEGEAPGKAVA